MTKLFSIFALLVVIISGIVPQALFADTTTSTTPVTRDNLQAQIDAKTQALNTVNVQLKQTQNTLTVVQTQRKSLQVEVVSLDANIKRLTLNIQSDQLNIQKLGLQVDELNYDLRDIQSEITTKQGAVVQLFRELIKREYQDGNLLMMFLKQGSLADGVLEAQTLSDLQSQLTLDIGNLHNLNDSYNQKLKQVSDNQAQITVHKGTLKDTEAIVQDQKSQRQILLTDTKQKESVYQQQVENLIKQQNQISDAISQIEDQLRATFNSSLLPTPRAGVLGWPVAMRVSGGIGRITQHYGEVSSLYRGKAHNGLDIGVPLGTPVYATADGVILAVDNNDKSLARKYQYGKYVLIKHDNNLATLYAHLSRQVVTNGQTIKRGDLIGYSGSTGYATGPHLHLGLYWAPSISMRSISPASGLVPIGVTIDPENYLCGGSCPIDGI